MDLHGKRVLVVGLGKSGLAAVRLLASRGARVIGNDLRSEAELGDAAARRARPQVRELVLGAHEPALFTSVDQIVLSPGRAADARARRPPIAQASPSPARSSWRRGSSRPR